MQTKPLHLDVNEQIECAQTLASRFYTDPAILDIEKPASSAVPGGKVLEGRRSIQLSYGRTPCN